MDHIGCDLLETVTPAAAGATRQLTTVAKVKAVMRETSSTYDSLLDDLVTRVSDDAARHSNLEQDGAGAFPTFGAEALRATWYAWSECRDDRLLLPWRPKVALTSVTENGVTLVSGTDYRLLPAICGGELQRLCGGLPIVWDPCWQVVVTLTAGWTLPTGVPPAVEARVIDQVRYELAAGPRDPALRSQSEPDLYAATYAVPGGDSIGEGGLFRSLEKVLAPYTRLAV